MNRANGLLAFVCTLLAAAAALMHVPVVSGIERIGRLASGAGSDPDTPLLVALTPPTASQLPAGLGGAQPLTLFALQRERRPDDELRSLAATHRLPFSLLKAHLAQACQGVLGDGGLFWPRLPEGESEVQDEARARTRKAVELLEHYRQQTGSIDGALLAWRAGPLRAGRVDPQGRATLEQRLALVRKRMLAAYREEAREWLCTVRGLATALSARWPVADRDLSRREGAGVRLAATPGERIGACMDGQVGFVGQDGPRGLCVELLHTCDLRTEVCDLQTVGVQPGQAIAAGVPLGTASSVRPRLNLWLGVQALDASQLLPPDPATVREQPVAPQVQLETIQLQDGATQADEAVEP